jgi:PAS domain S-box-containing protein
MASEPDKEPSPATGELDASRVTLLARILESFTESIDLDEVVRRVVTITREEFSVERAWILTPADDTTEYATIAYEATDPAFPGAIAAGVAIPLAPSRRLIRRITEADGPVVSWPRDGDVDPELLRRFGVRSQLVQLLRPDDDSPWAFGLHRCRSDRDWSHDEIDLFARVGRYATLALRNAGIHRRAVAEAAKVIAVLDQIPQAAAIYDTSGRLERLNRQARAEAFLSGSTPDERAAFAMRSLRMIETPGDLPSMRALRGESVRIETGVVDGTGAERVVGIRAEPVRDAEGTIVGSIVLSQDLTAMRMAEEQEMLRRRRAEVLAALTIDLFEQEGRAVDLDSAAERIGTALGGNVLLYLYRRSSDDLYLYAAWAAGERRKALAYLRSHPYRPGEGLAGTVFEIGRPLVFAEIRGDALTGFARDDEEKTAIGLLGDQSAVAVPIDSPDERLGALILTTTSEERRFDPGDLEFATAVADRIAVALRIHRLARNLQEGQRAAEELARREVDSRTRLEGVLDSAPVGIAVISADELRFELVNPLWENFALQFGRVSPETRLQGLRVAEVIPYLETQLQEVAERGAMSVDEAIRVRHGGQTLYFKQIISPVQGRFSGTTQSLTVLVQDVTEQARSQREIDLLVQQTEERSARLDSIIGSMTDALWVFDSRGNVIDVNPAALTMFGLASRSEAIEKSAFDEFCVRYPDGKPVPYADMPFVRALRGEVTPDFIATGRHLLSGNDLDLSIAAAPIQSGRDVVGAVLVIRDITALQELDRKKDEFLSVASHELRTPLTTIKGYSQLLTQAIDDLGPQERQTYLAAILGEVDRMMGLISELLDVSRIETNRLQLHRRLVRWGEFLDRQAQSMRFQHPQREIRFDVDVGDVVLSVDHDRIRQVLDNLVSNAVKYSTEGSPIDVVARRGAGVVELKVIDHGIGIPGDELPHLFERFHRARNVSSRYYGGLGLGLYITRAIVDSHGGSIRVTSEEGKGSVFHVALPI